MCLGGRSKPGPTPIAARAAPINNETPELDMDVSDQDTASDAKNKKKKGKKSLRILPSDSVNVNSSGAGLQIPR